MHIRRTIGMLSLLAMFVVPGVAMAKKETKGANSAIQTAVLKLSGMSCGGCVNMITGLLKSVKGVKDVKVTFKPQRARVKYDNTKTNTSALIAAVKKGGYGAVLSKKASKKVSKKAAKKASKKAAKKLKKGNHKIKKKIKKKANKS